MPHWLTYSRFTQFVRFAVVVGCCWSASATPAAEQYEEISSLPNAAGKEVDLTPYKDPRKRSQLRSSLLHLPPVGKAEGADLVNFETFTLVTIAEFTWPVRDPAKETPEQRRMYLKREIKLYGGSDTKSPDLHDFFNATILRVVPKLIDDDRYDPAVRYNYMLLLGQIDKLEFILGVRAIPEPVPECTTILLDKLHKENLPEALRVAAWIGLARQSEMSLSPQSRQAIVAEALKLLAAEQPLAGFSQNGHHWTRKLALQSITALALSGREVSERPETVKLLYDVIINDAEPLFLRREAVLALGSLDPAMFTGGPVKPAELVKALGNFTLQLTESGGGRDPLAPTSLSKASDVFPPPVDENKKLFAEGVAYYLNCVATALGGRSNRGLKAAPGLGDNAKLVKELLENHVDKMVILLSASTGKLDKDQLPRELKKLGDNLRSWMQGNALIAAVGGGNE